VSGERAVDEHQHAELDRAHPYCAQIGRKIGLQMRMVGACRETSPRKKQEQFTRRRSPGLGRDARERAPGDLRDSYSAMRYRRVLETPMRSSTTPVVFTDCCGFQEAFPAHAAVKEDGQCERVDHRDAADSVAVKHAERMPTMMIATTASPGRAAASERHTAVPARKVPAG